MIFRQARAHYPPRMVNYASKRVILGSPGVLAVLVLACQLSGCSLTPRTLPEVPDAPGAEESKETQATSTEGWTYSGQNGPANWASLSPEWAGCGDSASQSPVDLPVELLAASTGTEASSAKTSKDKKDKLADAPFAQSKIASQLGSLPLEATSDGQLVILAGASSHTITIDGKRASLDKVELHRPAEHSLSGVTFDFEMVFWFRPSGDSPVALSLLFRTGKANEALAPLITNLPKKAEYKNRSLGAQLSLPLVLSSSSDPKSPSSELSFFNYWGSASTPPCDAQIPRLVFSRVGELSPEQLEQLRAALPAASQRPIQPLGDRKVAIVAIAAPLPTSPPSPSVDPVSPSGSSPATKPQGQP